MSASFDQTDPRLPVEERTALGLKRCGVSITCASVSHRLSFFMHSRFAFLLLSSLGLCHDTLYSSTRVFETHTTAENLIYVVVNISRCAAVHSDVPLETQLLDTGLFFSVNTAVLCHHSALLLSEHD